MTLGERLKEMRRALRLSQTEFGRRIGTVQNTITGYETGRRSPSPQTLSMICREFAVNEQWLKDGEGEMFLPKPKATLDALVIEYNLRAEERDLLAAFLDMPPKERKDCIYYVRRAADLLNGNGGNGVPLTAADRAAQLDREEAAALDRVRAEFARKREQEQGA